MKVEVGAEAAAAAVLSAARAALDHDVELAAPPRVSVRDGRGAYICTLAGEAPAPWGAPLVVRVLPDRSSGDVAIAREAAWHALGAANGIGVPAVLAQSPDGPGPAAVVMARGPELSLLECIGDESREDVPRLVAVMGELHARLHGLPTDGVPGGGESGGLLDDLDRLLAASGLAGGHFAAELENLRRDERAGGPAVICHGRFQLSAVRLDPHDPASCVVADWSAAGVGEREYDVAQTMLTFWSLPYLAPGRARRQALRGVRDALIEGYRAAYERHARLDDDRLRYWEAFHALALSVRMATAVGAPVPDPWDPASVITFRDSYRKDLTRRFVSLTRRTR